MTQPTTNEKYIKSGEVNKKKKKTKRTIMKKRNKEGLVG
jgi:hypothetical protein